MKKITLNIEDDVFAELKSFLIGKGICGAMHGILDEFISKIIRTIDEGEKEELTFQFKNKKKRVK